MKQPKWYKNQLFYYLKRGERQRRHMLRKRWTTFCGECARRRVMSEMRRGAKRRKEYFGDTPIVCRYPPRL